MKGGKGKTGSQSKNGSGMNYAGKGGQKSSFAKKDVKGKKP